SGYPRSGWRAVVAAVSRYEADIGSPPLLGRHPRCAPDPPSAGAPPALARSRASAGLLAPSLAAREAAAVQGTRALPANAPSESDPRTCVPDPDKLRRRAAVLAAGQRLCAAGRR